MSRNPGCMFARIFTTTDHADQEALTTLLLSDRGHLDIARELTAAGYPMSEHTVRSHRKSDCTCGRI